MKPKASIIDIGSNTIRLSVFGIEKKLVDVLFSEKSFCGLGKNLESDQMLSRESMACAHQTLERYATLINATDTKPIIIATEALRAAKNAPQFIRAVEQKTKLKIDVLPGVKEAFLACKGVCLAFGNVSGIVCDIGGGSLEIAQLKNGSIIHSTSLPLGSLRLIEMKNLDQDLNKNISELLHSCPWLSNIQDPFYLVGGSFRSIARSHIKYVSFPFDQIHGYELQRDEAFLFLEKIMLETIDPQKIYVPKKRTQTFCLVALLLKILLQKTKAKKVLWSQFGLREGVLFEKHKDLEQSHNLFLKQTKQLAKKQSRFADLAPALIKWSNTLSMNERDDQRTIRHICCYLADIYWIGQAEHKGELSFRNSLLLPWPGIAPKQRAQMALINFMRHTGHLEDDFLKPTIDLLSKEELFFVKKVGLTLRLAFLVCNGLKVILKSSQLLVGRKYLTLHLPKAIALSNKITATCSELATLLNRTPQILIHQSKAC